MCGCCFLTVVAEQIFIFVSLDHAVTGIYEPIAGLQLWTALLCRHLVSFSKALLIVVFSVVD